MAKVTSGAKLIKVWEDVRKIIDNAPEDTRFISGYLEKHGFTVARSTYHYCDFYADVEGTAGRIIMRATRVEYGWELSQRIHPNKDHYLYVGNIKENSYYQIR